ncbi:pre-mRNA-splicing factor 18-like [Triticum dicoccoides]|uniref:pre-mRNA-splicing factor 18-like n=1 Tax=Triticum dicoccoides TaxID=85692 RepID=UPI00188EC6FA|nr:pre-mRNA-splicing factor 18-like [Triticum dicoccoides]
MDGASIDNLVSQVPVPQPSEVWPGVPRVPCRGRVLPGVLCLRSSRLLRPAPLGERSWFPGYKKLFASLFGFAAHGGLLLPSLIPFASACPFSFFSSTAIFWSSDDWVHCCSIRATPSGPPSVVADVAKAEDRADGSRELSLPREEVIRRLRLLRQPATLFGEDDAARLRGLHDALEDPAAVADVDAAEIGEGQTNNFLRDIQVMRAKAVVVASKPKLGAAERTSEEKEVPFDEDKIVAFFKRLLSEWSQELDEMPDAERRTAKGKAAVATCKQCARYLEPLFKLCRKKALPGDVRRALLDVVWCCMRRDYLAATDSYIKLAIGNSPWPIGVTMVGIHERSAREKIHTNGVAHVMDDETTRKYLQSVKRLMTFCQRRYPTDPSRSVEFNSLANGSDLQSLLAEKGAEKKHPEETLRLVAAS